MLNTLRFVQGAVAKKDFNPVLTHFCIGGGRIVGTNGRMTIGSPIDIDFSAVPKAVPLVKAIEACDGPVSLHMTPARRLAVCSGKFKAYIDCLEEEAYPQIHSACGNNVTINGDLVKLFRRLSPFIGIDASRVWSNSIMFDTDGMVYVTNNIILMQLFMPGLFTGLTEALCFPYDIIQEILRVKESPASLMYDERSITFFYPGDRWLQTVLRINDWPVQPASVFPEYAQCPEIPQGLFAALERVKSFVEVDKLFYMKDGCVCSHRDDGMGARVACEGIPDGPIFNIEQMLLLDGVAKSIDLSMWPRPCVFYGDNLRGVMVGAIA